MIGLRVITIGFVITLSLAATVPAAVVVDFEDLAAATYNIGGSFTSNGVQFDVIAYNGGGDHARSGQVGNADEHPAQRVQHDGRECLGTGRNLLSGL